MASDDSHSLRVLVHQCNDLRYVSQNCVSAFCDISEVLKETIL